MRISDWSSDVCSSDLRKGAGNRHDEVPQCLKMQMGDCGAPLAALARYCKLLLAPRAPAACIVLLVDFARDAFLAVKCAPHFARRLRIASAEDQQSPEIGRAHV